MKTAFKPVFLKILLSLGTLALLFGGAEITVRVMGDWDASGNFYFKNRIIPPHRMPVAMVAQHAAALRASEASIVTPHPTLGWTSRPGATSANGLYSYNTQGLRSPVPAYTNPAPEGTLRIALFGDSFTHGDDVPFEHTFGAVLEKMLNEAGLPAEVMNFGVGGYGFDQALLRFREQGAAFSPDLVVFGFAPENLKRNRNLVRPLYDPRSGLPFAKPRFILATDGIRLINVPVPSPEQLVEILRRFDDWELRPHEAFYDPADFQGRWWQASKLLGVAQQLGVQGQDPWLMKRIIFTGQGEEQQLGWALMRAFEQEASSIGARLLVLHLPSHPEMELHGQLGRWTYQTFLDALDGGFEVVHPEDALFHATAGGGLTEIFAGHYNAKGNRIIAETVFRHLVE